MEQILNGGIVLIVYPTTAEQFEAATAICAGTAEPTSSPRHQRSNEPRP